MAYTRGFSDPELPLYMAAESLSVRQKSCSAQCVQGPDSRPQGLAQVPGSLLNEVPSLIGGLPSSLNEVVLSREQPEPARLILRDDSMAHIVEDCGSEDAIKQRPVLMNQKKSPLERPITRERVTRRVRDIFVIVLGREKRQG